MCTSIIVGVQKSTNSCLPIAPQEPLSGLFLDDMTPGRIPLSAAFYKDTDLALRTMTDAIKEATTQVRMAIDSKLVLLYGHIDTTIGFKDTYTDFLPTSTDYRYLVLRPTGVRGGFVEINKISIRTNVGAYSGSIDVFNGSTNIYSGPLSGFEKKKLDLKDSIYIAYRTNDRPANFSHEPCCGQFIRHSKYVSVSSGTASALELIPGAAFFHNRESQGISVDIKFECDPFVSLCDLDFKRHVFGITFAKLVQQIARKSIALKILTDDKISSYAMVRQAEIEDTLVYLEADINKMLTFLPHNYSHSDCYSCTGTYVGFTEI